MEKLIMKVIRETGIYNEEWIKEMKWLKEEHSIIFKEDHEGMVENLRTREFHDYFYLKGHELLFCHILEITVDDLVTFLQYDKIHCNVPMNIITIK